MDSIESGHIVGILRAAEGSARAQYGWHAVALRAVAAVGFATIVYYVILGSSALTIKVGVPIAAVFAYALLETLLRERRQATVRELLRQRLAEEGVSPEDAAADLADSVGQKEACRIGGPVWLLFPALTHLLEARNLLAGQERKGAGFLVFPLEQALSEMVAGETSQAEAAVRLEAAAWLALTYLALADKRKLVYSVVHAGGLGAGHRESCWPALAREATRFASLGLDALASCPAQERDRIESLLDRIIAKAADLSTLTEDQAKSLPGYYEPRGNVTTGARYLAKDYGRFHHPGMPLVSVSDVRELAQQLGGAEWLLERVGTA